MGIDLVAMCVNDLVVQGAEPLFFLDYYASGQLEVPVGTAIVAGIAEGCRQAGCALIGGETAEMPGLYAAGDYDLAGFAVGAVERDQVLTGDGVAAGDIVLGLAASGLHSNGFSLVRRVVERAGLDYAAPAPFAPETSLGEALLVPTRIYVKSCLAALQAPGAQTSGARASGAQHGGIKALAHITGGGFPENLPRVMPKTLAVALDGVTWPVPPVFRWLAATGGVAPSEMLRTFNCGVGMVVVVEPAHAGNVRAAFEAAGETVFEIGRIQSRAEGAPSVTIDNLDASWPKQ